MKYFRKDIIKVQVVGSLYKHRILNGKMKIMVYNVRFFSSNAVCFIIQKYLVPVLFTFYIHYVLKFKKIIPAPKG